jgi:2-keto-4-pentenoate hydratase/2-oxohepta-3-ene-1,7-dioic acid hydratase in catechol pathway
MKLLTYQRNGEIAHGEVVDDKHIVEYGSGDLEGFLRGTTGPTGLSGPTGPSGPTGSRVRIEDVEVHAPLLRPGKLLGVAANYQDHVTESGAEPLDRSRISPRLFLIPPTAIVGPDQPIPLPSVSKEVDWEAELAVVIGRTAKDVAVEDALDVVAGYTIGNDISARSVDYGYPRDTDDKAVWFFDWLAGKWLDGFCPLGPFLVTADEIADPQDLRIELRVNDALRQQASTGQMIFGVAELIAHSSRLMTLEPGDVLLTGTPAGVGVTTGDYLASGDRLDVWISGLGVLSNKVS